MGLLQSAYETYCMMEKDYVGKYIADQKEPLAPIAHTIASANIEVAIDEEGKFVQAGKVDKEDAKTIIPVTEKSVGRTSTSLRPHPLCEQLKYLGGHNPDAYKEYVEQLERWCSSDYPHKKLFPILKYIKGLTLLDDLEQAGLIEFSSDGKTPTNEKLLVRWRVIQNDPDLESTVWKDVSLFKCFADYYLSQNIGEKTAFCMVSGENVQPAIQHAKGIFSLNGNAKLISANDNSNFTYRGRFTEDWQAASISYEVSQKSHNVLKWIITNQGVLFGGRCFVCWTPAGLTLPSLTDSLFGKRMISHTQASDYRTELKDALNGWKNRLPEIRTKAVIAAFDAATNGRLSLNYYNELQASDFLDRLYDWDSSCVWYGKNGELISPSLYQIINCAFGSPREENNVQKFVADDRVLKRQMQRLIACRVECREIPVDILTTLVNRASAPQGYDRNLWLNLLSATCAVIQKYHVKRLKGDMCMDWQIDHADRSFQFGRLLAVMERAESDFYRNTKQERETSAIKNMSRFRTHPLTVYEEVNRKLLTAYLPRLKPWQRVRYEKLRDEITEILRTFPAEDINKSLSEFYLMGYDMQRHAFFEGKQENDEMNEEE